jgi:hypothetical protein
MTMKDVARENTGTHMLDSGGASGRHWQQAAIPTDQPLEYAAPWSDGCELSGAISISTAQLLDEHGCIDAEETAKFLEWANTGDRADDYWMANIDQYVADGLLGDDGDTPFGGNSYNDETDLDQTFQWHSPSLYADLHLIQMHNGADVRGGYSAPVVWRGDMESVLCGWRVSLYCGYQPINDVPTEQTQMPGVDNSGLYSQCGRDAEDVYRADEDEWKFGERRETEIDVLCPVGHIATTFPIPPGL